MSVSVMGFRLVALHVQGVGPFQHEPGHLYFTDAHDDLANLYMILGVNGLGKTTILESVAHLVSLLDPQRGEDSAWRQDQRDARLQLDLHVRLRDNLQEHTILLSLIDDGRSAAERPHELRAWLPADLQQRDASVWVRLSRVGGAGGPSRLEAFRDGLIDEEAIELVRRLQLALEYARQRAMESELMSPNEDVPALLFFTAHRDLMRRATAGERSLSRPPDWTHSLVRRFDAELGAWTSSLDHLLVWLDYVDQEGGRFRGACEIVNREVLGDPDDGPFKTLKRVDREALAALVEVSPPRAEGGRPWVTSHRVDQLSGGERSLAQIFVRLAAHMTRNTILLIDEADLHLHPRWERGLMQSLMRLAAQHEGLTILLTTHSMDMLKVFDVHHEEDGLRKGGYILMPGFGEEGDDAGR